MSLTNPETVVTEQRLADFYQGILPYLGANASFTVMSKFNKSDLYSTDEQLVGRWINGKPVYQKVVEFISQKTIGTSWVDVGVNIVDGETVVYSCGMYGTDNPVTWVSAKITSNKLYVTSAGITSYIDKIIIQYTKTSDVSVNIGSDTDYSETEKIVGTWIDGKPIYQKTVDCGALPNNTSKNVAHNITNLGYVVNISGSSQNATSGAQIPIPHASSVSTECVLCNLTNTDIVIKTGTNRTSYSTSYVTVLYTKTS